MIRRFLFGGLLLCICASLSFGRQGMVKTKDGRTLEGDITDLGADGVTIKTKVGTITLNQADVAGIQYAGSVKELYEQRVAALPKEASAKAHVDLARWLYESKEYQLAQNELDKALAIEPTNTDALLLKQTVDRSMLWEMTRVQRTPGQPPAAGAPAAGANSRDRNLLTADQINIIRQQELRDTDRLRVRLDRNVSRQFAETQANVGVAEFARLPDQEKAMMILSRGTPEMRADVKILSDPQALAEFKARVQPVILQSCATANCHGGANSGSFRLYAPADNDAVTYTNFYILTQYAMKADGRKVINRTMPKDSLILEYGLPREAADTDHPETAGWNPAFRGMSDPKYLAIGNWLRNSLTPLEPQYGDLIKYTLPGRSPAPQPQAAPEAQPAAPQPAQPQQQPQPQPQPRADQPRNGAGGAQDALKEARERIRPMGIR